MKGIAPEDFAIKERQARVAKLYVRAWTQMQIAAEVGVSQRQISRDIKAIQEEWAKKNTSSIEASKLRALASIDQVEYEAWAEWERSKQDAEATTTEEMALGGAPSSPQTEGESVFAEALAPVMAPTKIRTRREVKGRLADARYLQVINTCRDDRCKLLGLYPTSMPVNWEVLRNMSREQIQRVAKGEDPIVVLATSSGVETPGNGTSTRTVH